MEIYIEQDDRKVEASAKTVKELLEKLKINPTTVIVVRNNELVTDKVKLNKNDKIKILSVISGG